MKGTSGCIDTRHFVCEKVIVRFHKVGLKNEKFLLEISQQQLEKSFKISQENVELLDKEIETEMSYLELSPDHSTKCLSVGADFNTKSQLLLNLF